MMQVSVLSPACDDIRGETTMPASLQSTWTTQVLRRRVLGAQCQEAAALQHQRLPTQSMMAASLRRCRAMSSLDHISAVGQLSDDRTVTSKDRRAPGTGRRPKDTPRCHPVTTYWTSWMADREFTTASRRPSATSRAEWAACVVVDGPQ